jgi:uncharacterized protein (TIRG00374 family)
MHAWANVKWDWVLFGIACDLFSYVIQALRWKFLLAPFGEVRLNRAIRAIYTGLFANFVFPLRPGEFLRCYLLSNSEEITIGRVLGSVGVERFVDLVIATASLAIVSLVVDLPQRFQRVADTLGFLILFLLFIVVALILYIEIKLGTNPEPEVAHRKLPGKVMVVLTDLHAMGTSTTFYAAVIASVAMPACQVLGIWAVMHSYDLRLSFLAAVVVLLIINLGVSLPNAPANVGAYQLFCVLGLSVFQVEKTTATGFAFFAFLVLTLPPALIGFAASVHSGLSVKSIREKVSGMPQQQPLRSSAQD